MATYRIPEMAKQYMNYDMIQLYTELPEFPNVRTKLLYLFLHNNRLGASLSELYAFVVSLVQMGLDTHELVTDFVTDIDTDEMRSRQMKVLAGDYFSSRFYYLLAQHEQIDMVKQLSNSICEVNRLKVNFYMMAKQAKITAEEYIQQTIAIRSKLYLPFKRFFSENDALIWPEILEAFTHCEILTAEIVRNHDLNEFVGSWGYWNIVKQGSKADSKKLKKETIDLEQLRLLVVKYDIAGKLQRMLDQQITQLWSLCKRLDSDQLANDLQTLSETFIRLVSTSKAQEE